MEKNSFESCSETEKKTANSELVVPLNHAEGFQFSFNDLKQEKKSVEDSPSPKNENLIEKLSELKAKMQTINNKIQETSEKVLEKQKKTQELKSLLENHEANSKPSDSSQVSCACRGECSLL